MSMPVSFELSLWQKRQATLLYHFASLNYLKGLKPLIDSLINGTDLLLDTAKEQGRDTLLVSSRWGARDTAANWDSYGFPALIDFRESTIRDIAQRAYESYSITGANNCARMLGELSMIWATREEEDAFKDRLEQVIRYAGEIDDVMRRPPTNDDFTFWVTWNENKALFPRLPIFRVRTDVAGETNRIPPRTGVYVPQDDPYGALQFRWTGGGYGELCETYTFNEFGLRALDAVGRDGLWGNQQALLEFAMLPENRGIIPDDYLIIEGVPDAELAPSAVAREAFVGRACKWYFVEMVNGEFESDQEVDDTAVISTQRRVPAGQPCPRSGYWFTPARKDSRQSFNKGDIFPEAGGSDYGATFWLWSHDQ